MLLNDSFTVRAPVETVWALLQDVSRISSCVPGVDSVTQTAPDTYQGTLKVKVGPISAAFQGAVRFTERTAQERIVAEVDGQDKSTASLVKATFSAMLRSVDGGTQVDYEVDVALRGRLGQFGATIVQATAKKMTAEFARCLQEILAPQESMLD